MNINALASAIYRGIWYMDERLVEGYLPLIARFLNGESTSFFDIDDKVPTINIEFLQPDGSLISCEVNSAAIGKGGLFNDAPDGSIAIIPLSGVVMKSDGICGEIGSDTMGMWMREAAKAPNISGIIKRIDSGGGQVSGTAEYAQIIKETSLIKPVNSISEGLIASAAYWLGMSASGVFASSATVEVGSIGTCIRFMDNSKALADRGYIEHYVNSDTSPDKNKDIRDAKKGDYAGIITNMLNPTNDVFLNAVKAERAGKLNLKTVKIEDKEYQEPLTGKVYLAKEAIELGLIDGIKSFDNVLDLTVEQTKNTKSYHLENKSNKMFGNKFKELAKLATVAVEALTATQLEAVNTELEQNDISGVTLVLDSELSTVSTDAAKVPDLEKKVNDLTTAQAADQKTITDLNAEILNLKKELGKPAEAPVAPVTNETDGTPAPRKEVDSFETSYDREMKAAFGK